MSTMQAALIVRHGGPEVLEVTRVETPEPGPGDVRLAVKACALNHLDIFVRRGMPGIEFNFPHVSGGDVVGVVDKCGASVDASLSGKTVLVDPNIDNDALGEGKRWGALAEYVIVPADSLIPLDTVPDDLHAYVALPIAYGTAHRMLFTRCRLHAGETIAVLGASGGVGVACVQLGHATGARVIACSGSDEKLGRLRQFGAGETVNTSTEDFSKRVWELTGKHGADVVIDYTGKETWPSSIRCTKPGGRLATCGATTGYDASTDLRYVWTRELDILGCNGWMREDLLALIAMVRDGGLRPVISSVYPLSRIAEAEAELEDRRALGKVIVVPDEVMHAA
ncbi:MAG TPA: zinc-binding dehydrogenase [Chloroflexota bacterium]|jgi:NADPH:quinone reductase-like Zn-dependent oxidoreductase|nr:zinc-binding dehydrogenase [Chloroflexota bacterium]